MTDYERQVGQGLQKRKQEIREQLATRLTGNWVATGMALLDGTADLVCLSLWLLEGLPRVMALISAAGARLILTLGTSCYLAEFPPGSPELVVLKRIFYSLYLGLAAVFTFLEQDSLPSGVFLTLHLVVLVIQTSRTDFVTRVELGLGLAALSTESLLVFQQLFILLRVNQYLFQGYQQIFMIYWMIIGVGVVWLAAAVMKLMRALREVVFASRMGPQLTDDKRTASASWLWVSTGGLLVLGSGMLVFPRVLEDLADSFDSADQAPSRLNLALATAWTFLFGVASIRLRHVLR